MHKANGVLTTASVIQLKLKLTKTVTELRLKLQGNNKLAATYLVFCSNFKIEPKITNNQQYHAIQQ